MLSYRHHFHAGNFADIHKHFLLYQVLTYVNQKPKPYLYLDTHGGAGLYDTKCADAQKNREADGGVVSLYRAPHLPPALEEFRQFLQNITPELSLYPGSPFLAAHLLRRNDTLRTCELHPSDFPLLTETLKNIRPHHTLIHPTNGYQALRAALPPPQHRAVVLIDPSYEDKQEYFSVIYALEQTFKRFRASIILVWYPQLPRVEAQELPQKFIHTAEKFDLDYLQSTLTIKAPPVEGYGMYGSGMMIFNPPYTLPNILDTVTPTLIQLLGQDNTANHQFNTFIR
ncbi:23S rRNA (adenine(2030)-N(6))-methyltransferase RlmJ [Suttonella ornithocola]|uniref:Ribosomal RNA large subunit methyltransferase J n=1 Tax=Suttonella ornithocola TaxID=279832 RepID=A0A380MWM4_9GAMM|nr:23S rRNA (adenine(2030)-N(6))-methyltransferase RlmJ [Suttonella ornithocola]SUO96975.1 Protein involved in catabolism of external DNA [Suttonella ornithocola]